MQLRKIQLKRKAMNFRQVFLLTSLALFTQEALPHGMDKPGPHGGYVRMPGAFHTEVVAVGENEWKIYLLDENFKNPMVKNSSVSGTVELGQEQFPLTCEERDEHFTCGLQNNAPKAIFSKLRLEVKRGGGAIGISIYKLPLSFR